MKARTLFERGSLAGPWWVRLEAFHKGAWLMGVSWQRYLDCFELCLDPLPLVSLRITRKLARSLAPKVRAWRLVEYGSERDPLQIAALIVPSSWTVGVTWFRDFEGFELVVHLLPTLVLFYTRTKGAQHEEAERASTSRRPQTSGGDWPKAHQYTCRVHWSEEDGEYVATCDEFPSLSWLSGSPDDALNGIRNVIRDVLGDMQSTGETPPKPGSAP